MKNSNKKAIGKNLLNGALSFLKGVTTANPVINMVIGGVSGIAKGIQSTKGNNLASEVGGVGKVAYSGLVGSIVGGVIIVGGGFSMMMGWVTLDDLKNLMKLWESTQ